MNIRRGFNRLSLAVYVGWLLLLGVALYTQTSSQRSYYVERLAAHERISNPAIVPGKPPQAVIPGVGTVQFTEDVTEEQIRKVMPSVIDEAQRINLDVLTPAQREWTLKAIAYEKLGRIGPKAKAQLDSIRQGYGRLSSDYLSPAQVAEYTRKRDNATFVNGLREAFTGWTGWLLAVFVPVAAYLLLLGTGYTLRWIYRGFAG